MTELWHLGAAALEKYFVAGRASPVEALEATLERIAAVDETIGAFRHVSIESARSDAHDRTEELAHGVSRGPLHGVPIAIKELFNVRGAPADYGSDALSGRVADTDAELVRRLRHAGAVVVGTTRSHEFGWGITTQHQSRRGTCNPWDQDRVPGGSSGGSAAAVALGMVPVAIGSDTGGSIRIPASFCGVAGLKPTFGRVSRTGGVALAPSFDTPGVLARCVGDAATVVGIMSGADGVDSASPLRSPLPEPLVTGSLHGVRIATSDALTEVALDADIAVVYARAVDLLQELGAELVEIELPDAGSIRAAFVPLQMAEAYDVHHRSLGLFPYRSADYGSDVRSRLEAAAEVSVGQYLEAQEERGRVIAAFDHELRTVDAIVSPISAVAPSRIDNSDIAVWNGENRQLRDLVMQFTVPQNVTGLPAAIVRAGFDPSGLPVGLQLTAGRWHDSIAVGIASVLEMAIDPTITPIPLQTTRKET